MDVAKSMGIFVKELSLGKLMTIIPHPTGTTPVGKRTAEFITVDGVAGWAPAKPAMDVARDIMGKALTQGTGKLEAAAVAKNFLGWGAFGAGQVGWEQVESAVADL